MSLLVEDDWVLVGWVEGWVPWEFFRTWGDVLPAERLDGCASSGAREP